MAGYDVKPLSPPNNVGDGLVMAMEAGGQDMQEKPAHELIGRERHGQRVDQEGHVVSDQLDDRIARARIGSPARSSTSVTASSTGLTLAGAGRGSRGLAEALRSNSSWIAPSRESSTPA